MIHTVAYAYVVLVLLALVIYIFNKDHCREQTQKVELPTFPIENPPAYGRFFPLLDLFAGVFYGPSQFLREPQFDSEGSHQSRFFEFPWNHDCHSSDRCSFWCNYHFTKVPNRKELERTALVYELRNISQLENQGWFFETGIAMANNNFVAETCTPSKSCIFLWDAWLPTSWKNQGKSSCKYII